MLTVAEAEPVAAGQQQREAAAGMAADLRTAQKQHGVVEQRTIAGLNRGEPVHQPRQALAVHAVAQTDQPRIGVVHAAVAGTFVMIIVNAASRRASRFGPILVLVVSRPGLAAETLRDHASHVRLKRQRDQIHHQFDVLTEACFAFGFGPHARFVELRPPLLEDGVAVVEPLFDFADRSQILLHPLLVSVAEPPLQVLHVADRRVEDAAIQRDAGLGLLEL